MVHVEHVRRTKVISGSSWVLMRVGDEGGAHAQSDYAADVNIVDTGLEPASVSDA